MERDALERSQPAGPSGSAGGGAPRYQIVRVHGRGAFGEARCGENEGLGRQKAGKCGRFTLSHTHNTHTQQVLLARDALTGDQVAIKRVFVPDPALGLPQSLAREIGALQKVRHHPNVVRLIDAFAVVEI